MTGGTQGQINAGIWSSGRWVGRYAHRDLRPAEVLLLVRHREVFAGRVLEIGCGAGRATGYLLELASSLTAIDIAPAMVAYCRERYPGATYEVRDLRDLDAYGRDAFDLVFAGDNVLDVLGHEERLHVLRTLRDVLAPSGLLVFSTHNRAHLPFVVRPPRLRPGNGWYARLHQLAGMPILYRNHRRLRALERSEAEYAIANDNAHRYTLLHYYIDRDAQERQLDASGFTLVEAVDLEGRPVAAGEHAAESSALYYAAGVR